MVLENHKCNKTRSVGVIGIIYELRFWLNKQIRHHLDYSVPKNLWTFREGKHTQPT